MHLHVYMYIYTKFDACSMHACCVVRFVPLCYIFLILLHLIRSCQTLMFSFYEYLRFLKEGRTGCNIHGLELWTVHRLILTRMLIWWLLVERSGNTFKLVLSMDTWHIRWGQNILLSFYLMWNSNHNIFLLCPFHILTWPFFHKFCHLPPTTLFLILFPITSIWRMSSGSAYQVLFL